MTESELIMGLKNNKEEAYSALYDRFYPSVKYYILRNNGNQQDAEDIFQEASIVVLQKIREDKLELTASLKTYFYSVARNLWLKKLRDMPKAVELINLEDQFIEEDALSLKEREETSEVLTQWLHTLMIKLTGHCLMLMTKIYFVEKYIPVKYEELGYKNAHTFQNQKYKCLQQLKKAANASPLNG